MSQNDNDDMTTRMRDRSTSQPRRAQDLLTCMVCCQYLEDPRQLPCGHTFCRKCLERHHALHLRESETRARPASDERRTVGLLPCPLAPSCLHVAVVPPEGVAGFPFNERIAGIKERVVNQMAENILRRMPAAAGSCASDNMSTFSDASCETTCSAPAGNACYDSGDDDAGSKYGGGLHGSSSRQHGKSEFSKFNRYFDDGDGATEDGGAEAETASPRYTPGSRSDRRRVGYSTSFQHRRRRVNVSSPTAFDDASPMREFLRRQPSRSGSAPHLDEEKPSSVRGIHLREPLRRNANLYAERVRPTSAILEEILFNSNRSSNYDNEHSAGDNSSGSYYSRYQPRDDTTDGDVRMDNFYRAETDNLAGKTESEKTNYASSSATAHRVSREADPRTPRYKPDGISPMSENDIGSSSRQSQEPTSQYSRSYSASRSRAADETDDVSYHSHERGSSSSRLLGNRRRVGTEQAERPDETWTSHRRKLPDTPVQSYAERIKSKYRSSTEFGGHAHDSYYSDKLNRSPGDSTAKPGKSGEIFEKGIPLSNNRNSFQDIPKYESQYKSAKSHLPNETGFKSNVQSEPILKPNLPRSSGTPVSEAARSPLLGSGLRGSGMKMSWNGNGTHPMESPWSGLSKYLDGSSDSSDDSDCDMIINRSSKKKSDAAAATSTELQANNISSNNADEMIQVNNQPDASNTSGITDRDIIDSTSRNVNTDFKQENTNGNGSVDSSCADHSSRNGDHQLTSEKTNFDEKSSAVQNGSSVDSSVTAPAENVVVNSPADGHQSAVVNGSPATSHTNGHAKVDTAAKSDVPDVNGNASDADKENTNPKGGRSFDDLMRAARAKYSTYDAPNEIVRKPVLTPVCSDGMIPRWRMQRDDFAEPTCVAISSTGSVFVSDVANSSLDYVDEDGNLIHSITGMRPYSVTAITAGDVEKIYVGDRKSRSVRVFDSFGCDLAQWDSETTSFGWIAGIASLKNGNLVIVDRERCKVGVYTVSGDRVLEFGAYGANEKQVCMADFVAVDSHDRVIVADSGNHCLKMFDPNAAGKPIGRISQRGDDDGSLHWPKGIAVDKYDNVIVADTNNNRVSQFASDGRFISHLITGTPKPYHVGLNAAGDMLSVTHFALSGFSQVDIFSLEKTE